MRRKTSVARFARARRRRRCARAAAARTRASSCRTASGGRRSPSCARPALAVGRREEEAAAFVVAEQLDREQREPARLLEPAQLAGRDVQLVEAVRDVRVVLEEARALGDAVAVRAVEPAVGRRERPEQELAEPPRRRRASRRVCRRRPASASAASARPFQDAIALSSRSGFGRCSRRSSSSRLQLRRQLAAEDEAAVLERLEELVGHALVRRPRERQPFDAVRVGVLRRREAALGQRELAQHVRHRLLDDLAVALVAGHEPAVQVRGHEQRVVVEHLLEVRHEPALVDGVAVEAAAEQVVHAAERHPVERLRRRLELAAAQQELERRRLRELRRAAPSRPSARRSRSGARAPPRGAATTSAARATPRPAPTRARSRSAPAPAARRRRAARGTRARPSAAPGGSPAARAAAPAGSTCRRRTARRRA